MTPRLLGSLGFIAAGLTIAASGFAQSAKPREITLGISTFMTGAPSVLGQPAKQAAELWIENFNKQGGVAGVPLKPIWIDEGAGSDKFLSEYRRIAQEPGEKVMLSALSSGNCNAVAPVAENLKVLNILWECSTEKVLEERRYNYVFRTGPNATMEMVAAVAHLLGTKPDFNTIAVLNQDYAWGRDSWEIFRNTLLAMRPGVRIVAEMFPKFGASDFSTEITRLQALRPDVILSTSWGADLETFVRQASQRGLFKSSQFVLPLADAAVLARLGSAVPSGVLVGFVGDTYFEDPEFRDTPAMRNFVDAFRAKTGAYPPFAAFHMVQALTAITDTYSKALQNAKGQWPTTEQLAATLQTLEFKAVSRPIRMRADGQALQGQLYGVTKQVAGQSFPTVDQLVYFPPENLTPPIGQKSPEWVKGIRLDQIKSIPVRARP